MLLTKQTDEKIMKKTISILSKSFILFFFLSLFSCSSKIKDTPVLVKTLQDGDLLFIAKGKPNAITDVTSGVDGLKIDHVGIYVSISSCGYVLEACPPKVRLTTMADFQERAKKSDKSARIIVGRITSDVDVHASIKKAMSYIGRKYDYLYLPDDNELYCSELVQKSFVDSKGHLVFTPIPMTFRDKNGKIPDVFVNMYKSHDIPVPEGEPGSNPGDLSRRPQLRIWYYQ